MPAVTQQAYLHRVKPFSPTCVLPHSQLTGVSRQQSQKHQRPPGAGTGSDFVGKSAPARTALLVPQPWGGWGCMNCPRGKGKALFRPNTSHLERVCNKVILLISSSATPPLWQGDWRLQGLCCQPAWLGKKPAKKRQESSLARLTCVFMQSLHPLKAALVCRPDADLPGGVEWPVAATPTLCKVRMGAVVQPRMGAVVVLQCSTTQNEGCGSRTRGINMQPPSLTLLFGTGLQNLSWWQNDYHYHDYKFVIER